MRIGRAGAPFLLAWLASLPVLAASLPSAGPNPVPIDIRDKIEEYFRPEFILPQTNIWRFDSIKPFISGDQVVCGWVNFQSAAQLFVGYRQFYAIVHQGDISLAQMSDVAEDTSGARASKLALLCGPPDPPAH
jgi:hypothetical protein